MNRVFVSLLLLAAVGCETREIRQQREEFERRAAKIADLERELGECRTQLASRGSAQGGTAPVAAPPSGRTIDFGFAPHIPDGWSIRPEDQIKSAVRGQLALDPAQVRFHLDPGQQGGTIVGTELRKQLEGKPVLPAQVLEYLFAHTALIPDFWKQDEHGNTRYIDFWGTVYRGHDGRLYVRYLYWCVGQWHWDYYCLTREFGAVGPAAILAS